MRFRIFFKKCAYRILCRIYSRFRHICTLCKLFNILGKIVLYSLQRFLFFPGIESANISLKCWNMQHVSGKIPKYAAYMPHISAKCRIFYRIFRQNVQYFTAFLARELPTYFFLNRYKPVWLYDTIKWQVCTDSQRRYHPCDETCQQWVDSWFHSWLDNHNQPCRIATATHSNVLT